MSALAKIDIGTGDSFRAPIFARTLGAVARDAIAGGQTRRELAEMGGALGTLAAPASAASAVASVGAAFGAEIGLSANDDVVSPEEQAEIVVTARRGVAELRTILTGLPAAQQGRVRAGLTQGTPAPEFIVPHQSGNTLGFGNIPGGPSNPDDTLAGGINDYAFFTADTQPDLAGWLVGLGRFVDPNDPQSIAGMIERLDWETDGNDMMLAGNIAALHATGDPTLAEVARGLEEVAAGRWHDYGAAATAQADRAVEDIVRLNPVFDDILLARDAIQGRASKLDIGVAVGSHTIPVVGALGGRIIKAESRIARAARIGREGENLAGIAGRKVGILIGKTGRYRFPDHIDEVGKVITEVKNVKYQGWTKQLADYAEYARENGYSFVLKLRPGATPSRNLVAAEAKGEVRILPLK